MQWLIKNCQTVFQIPQKKKKKTQNLDIKISERPKNIKESDDSLLKNY